MTKNFEGPGLTYILIRMVQLWGRKTVKKLWKTRTLQVSMLRARRRRQRILKKEGLRAPLAIALSPTMRCNLSCEGCYSRFHPQEGEMSIDTIETLVHSASEAGVFLFVITGGEPYLRPEMMNIYKKHRNALFLTVTNGTLIDESTVSEIAACRNILPVVSLEGTLEQTDRRRGSGTFQKALDCMRILKSADVPFGFSAVLTHSTIETLGSGQFAQEMVNVGCTIGFFNELIPVSSDDLHLVPSIEQRQHFRESLGRIRKREPIVLVHLPDDEYDNTGRCMAVSNGVFHVNAQGYVEPCPFAHYARENVSNQSFKEILASPFLEAIRRHPTVLQCGDVGCSLMHNRAILEKIAGNTGAKATSMIFLSNEADNSSARKYEADNSTAHKKEV